MSCLTVDNLHISKLNAAGASVALLSGVSFSVNAGEILTIIGPNGAGKSTLLNAVADHLDFPNDTINIANIANDQVTAARQLAVLKQFSTLNFPFRVFEVLQLGRTPHTTGVKIDEVIIHQVLEAMDISHLKNRYYTHLSGGEKQRVQLARVLVQIWRAEDAHKQNRLLLLDEPIESLDLGHQQQLMQVLKQLSEQSNITIIMVLHNINLAMRYSDKLLALHEGKVLAHGAPFDVITTQNIQTLYGTKAYIIDHPEDGMPTLLL